MADSPAVRVDTSSFYRILAITGGLLFLSFMAFYGWSDHILLFWDDEDYVSRNPWITQPSWDGILAMFSQIRAFNWHPLTWLSFLPEYYFCGDTAACYKATNVVLHGLNGLFVFLFASYFFRLARPDQTADKRSALVAGLIAASLFVVHPIHTESVIWVSERKDLLCALFFFAAMWRYLSCQEKGVGWTHTPFLLFLLALLSKPMAVTLPAVLILLDYYPLGRFRNRNATEVLKIALLEKLHYFAAAFAVALVVSLSQVPAGGPQPDLIDRLVLALVGISHYLMALVYPLELSPFYPAEIATGPLLVSTFAVAALLSVTVAIGVRISWGAALLFSGFFLVTLSPVSGIVKIGYHAYADRYAYMPTAGFFILFGGVGAWLWQRGRQSQIMSAGITIVVALLLLVSTRHYKDSWKDNVTLWEGVAAAHPDLSDHVHFNLGAAYMRKTEYPLAIAEFRRGIALNSQHTVLRVNLANSLFLSGEVDAAIEEFEKIPLEMPIGIGSYLTAADGLVLIGEEERAIPLYEYVSIRDQDFGLIKHRMALILGNYGHFQRALDVLHGMPKTGPGAARTLAMIERYQKNQDSASAAAVGQTEP